MHEQMRHRRRASSGAEQLRWSDTGGGNFIRDDDDHALEERLVALRRSGTAAAAFFTSLGKALGESSSALVQSIKKVASQPALAGPGGHGSGLGTAADGVLASLRNVKQEWMSRRSMGMAAHGMPPPAPRSKQAAKVD